MEQTFKSTDERNVGYGPAYVVKGDAPDYLVGRLLTIIETVGLPEKQEKSIKDLIRSEVYGQLELSTWIDGGLHNIIKDFNEWYSSNDFPTNGGIPNNLSNYKVGDYTLTFKA